MSNQNPEITKNEPLEWFVIAFIVFCITVFSLIKYHMDIWYHTKKPVYAALNVVPTVVLKTVFFYAHDAVDLIPVAYKDLKIHSKDFSSYYKNDPVGKRKKNNIDKATWKMWSPWVLILFVFVVYKEKQRIFGGISKPGTRHAMYGYIKTMQHIFPYVKPAIPYMEKISSMPSIDTGWFANAMIPSAWVKNKGLTTSFSQEKQRTLIVKSQRLRFALDEDATYLALREQLGRPWAGINDLDFIEKCCLTVLCPHIFGRTKESRLNNRNYLNNLNVIRAIMNTPDHSGKVPKVSEQSKKQMIDFVEKSINKYRDCFSDVYFELTEFDEPFDPILASFESLNSESEMEEKAKKIIKQVILNFRYVNTIFLALYDRSWMYGVLSSSEVLWIKEFNRAFYYVMAQQGRLSCFVEAAGPWAHYLAEKAHGYRMLSPQLYESLLALDRDLFETHDNYIPIVDWSDAARWNKMVPDLSDTEDGGSSRTTRSGSTSLL